MKRLLVLLIISLLVVSCGSKNRGELIGVKQKKWFGEKPYGMQLIEGGSYIMGKSDEDIAQLQNAPARTVTVPSFYMDETEITNSEYRQFVYWVKDSTALAMLARKADELELDHNNLLYSNLNPHPNLMPDRHINLHLHHNSWHAYIFETH